MTYRNKIKADVFQFHSLKVKLYGYKLVKSIKISDNIGG